MVREKTVESFYWRLRESAKASCGSPLLIFPSTSDVDSLCALKIILHVLESDSVGYSCYPVSSFQDIHKYSDLCSSSQNPISILLINWGSHRDLRRLLNLSPLARVFVVDSHCPIHLHNLSEHNERVVVLYTEKDEQLADLVVYDIGDLSALANKSDLNSDDEVDEESDSDSESDEGSTKKRRRVSGSEDKLFKRLKKKYYHLGTFHGKPSGCLMYDLAHSLHKNTSELLWLSCVSLTDQFVHERYLAVVMELRDSGSLEAVTSVTLKDGTNIRVPSSNRIAFEEEPRLMLLREWSLFESMKCSSYSATKIKTWSDKGVERLQFLLGHMGFALVDCQQKFQFMNSEVKKRMKAQFKQWYGTDFYYPSFLRLHGYGSRVSAADVVYGVTALLESFVESDGSCAAKQFGVAYDALSLNNLDMLKAGMQKAIRVQRAVVRQGSRAVTMSGCIRSRRKFRAVKLEDSVDAKLLGYPLALTKFCYFVMDALKEKGAKMKPLVCACSAQYPKKMIVVGVCGKPRVGAVRGNSFGIAFRSAAQEASAEFFHEMFESSWIILDSGSLELFMDQLRRILQS